MELFPFSYTLLPALPPHLIKLLFSCQSFQSRPHSFQPRPSFTKPLPHMSQVTIPLHSSQSSPPIHLTSSSYSPSVLTLLCPHTAHPFSFIQVLSPFILIPSLIHSSPPSHIPSCFTHPSPTHVYPNSLPHSPQPFPRYIQITHNVQHWLSTSYIMNDSLLQVSQHMNWHS